mgnify:CR=1 FL=1|tara:strand:+ start:428 stop:1030 length:603 start_codon:yes stop_codon:yes gene_type:complete
MGESKNINSEFNKPLKRLNVSGLSFLMSPPENDSDKTTIELELIENIGRRINFEDSKNIKEYEENIVKQYTHVMDQFSLNYNKEELEEIIEDIVLIVEHEKKRHRRPRPQKLGSNQGYVINEEYNSFPNDSYSYPSSHCTQSMFLYLYLAEQYPIYKNVFVGLNNKISNSRLLSSSNYPTDNLAGQTLASVLYNRYREKK